MRMLLEAAAILFAVALLAGAVLFQIEPALPPAYSGPAYNHDVPEYGPARGHSGGVIRWDGRKEIGV